MEVNKFKETLTRSPEATLALAEVMGGQLKGGELIELISDLGGGKTTFVKGLAHGMGSNDLVHSPSFTLSNEYRTSDKVLRHYDFYRLSEPGIMKNELEDILQDNKVVAVVEWPDILQGVLPSTRLRIHIKVLDNTSRQFIFEYPPSLSYLVPKT